MHLIIGISNLVNQVHVILIVIINSNAIWDELHIGNKIVSSCYFVNIEPCWKIQRVESMDIVIFQFFSIMSQSNVYTYVSATRLYKPIFYGNLKVFLWLFKFFMKIYNIPLNSIYIFLCKIYILHSVLFVYMSTSLSQ